MLKYKNKYFFYIYNKTGCSSFQITYFQLLFWFFNLYFYLVQSRFGPTLVSQRAPDLLPLEQEQKEQQEKWDWI